MSDEGVTFVTDHQTGEPVARRFVVEVTQGPDRGLTLMLPAGTILVGSGDGMDLRLNDKEVSRRHLEAAVVDEGVRVRDLGSKNGVRCNGIRVSEAVLGAGAVIALGRHTALTLRNVDEPLAVEKRAWFGGLVGRSKAMASLFGLLERAAKTRATALVEGETGTGKEEIARALHDESPWRDKPFLVLDCGSLSPSLVASELFGHKKGAFTGAVADRAGIFEAAHGGTVLLDEIGELPLELQPSLLRVLESRTVRRLGENHARDVDVRVVAATHRDLEGEVARNRFRGDLFFRLALIRVRVPPLRERKEDIPVLVERLLKRAGVSRAPSLAELAALAQHTWPGNVRELKNVVDLAAALGVAFDVDSARRPAPDAPRGASDAHVGDYRAARGKAIADFERGYVVALLRAHAGNVSSAAREAGVDRNWLHRLIKRYDIQRAEIGRSS